MPPRDVRWLAAYGEGDETRFRIGVSGEHVVAEWVDVAVLAARRDGTDTSLRFLGDVAEATREKIERGAARLLLHHLTGGLGLHGACVGRAGRAVILLGRSGAGKSSLAAALCRRGLELFADDAVVLDVDPHGGLTVEPTERVHWLDEGARLALALPASLPVRGEKHAYEATPARSPARVVAVLDLAFVRQEVSAPREETPRLERLEGTEALAALVPQVGRFVLDDPHMQVRELEQLTAVLALAPLFRFNRPRSFGYMDAAASLVERTFLSPEPSR
jgi:hypothetical protein